MNFKKLTFTAVALAISATSFATPNTPELKNFTKQQRAEIKAYVQNYIMTHPKEIVIAIQKMQMDAQLKQMAESKKIAIKNATALTQDNYSPAINSGKVTLVEFFDYQCSVCHMMYPQVEKIIKENPNVRVVFKEFPIFGPASEFAAKASIAARLQGQTKFLSFHNNMFKSGLMEGKLKTDDVLRIAKQSGLDMTKLKSDMSSKAVTNELKSTYALAQTLRLSGTPAFAVLPTDGKDSKMLKKASFIPGAARYETLENDIKNISS